MLRKKWLCRQGTDGTTLFIPIEDATTGGLPDSRSHFVQQDTIDPIRHPANGQIYDSRSQYDRVTKSYGYREIGNDYMTKDGTLRPITSKKQQESTRETVRKTLEGYRREVHG